MPPVPVEARAGTHGGKHGVGVSRRNAESHDVAVVSSAEQHGTGTATAHTTTTNYILVLFSSSSSAQNNTNLSLVLGGRHA